MHVDIGGTVAKCFSCGGKEFAALGPNTTDRSDRLACVHCCTEVAYEDLFSQVARAAIARRSVPYAAAQKGVRAICF